MTCESHIVSVVTASAAKIRAVTGSLRQMTDGCFSVLGKSIKRRLDRLENRNRVVHCDCGWEIETGYAVAVGLATLEAKRLFLIAIGIFVEWNVLRFSGGLVPLVLTVLSATLGVPAALGAVFTIHKRREEPCFPSLKKLLKYVSVVILLCVILNAIVMVSVAVYLSVRPEAIARAFNASMAFYSRESWHKVTIDQLQFTFQCCGHTKYDDWIAFDWQKVDYASREEMFAQPRISDEKFRPMAVPYSCCSVQAMTPCFHADLSMNIASINEAGCARVLSPIILRNVAVTYCVSTFLVFTQILLALLMIRVSKRPLPLECPSFCECAKNSPSAYSLLESNTSFTSSNGCTSGDLRNSLRSQDRGSRLSTIESQSGYDEGSSSSSPSSPPSSRSKKNSSARTRCSGGCGAARIRPSLHTEHRVPKKRTTCQKCTRPN